jgi:hypothetical protein
MSLPRPERLFEDPVGGGGGGETAKPPWGMRPASASKQQQRGGDHKAAALRRIERQRRLLHRAHPKGVVLPIELLGRITYSSFRLENLSISERDVAEALSCGAGRRALRPPHLLRVRNHVAILRHIQKATRRGQELKLAAVVRWYTSISCGLSMGVDLSRADRLGQFLRRINSPQLRLQQAVADVAQVHAQLTADPMFPGFNGILARLLLQYHLARCRLPMVTFAMQDAPAAAPDGIETPLMAMISDALESTLRTAR